MLLDPDAIYFPDPETVAPLAIAFAQMMFAHAKFEDEFRSLQGAITNDLNAFPPPWREEKFSGRYRSPQGYPRQALTHADEQTTPARPHGRPPAGACPEGCTAAVMRAHGFTVEQIVALVRAGRAHAQTERIFAGVHMIEVSTPNASHHELPHTDPAGRNGGARQLA
jgi:hypothetical protein